MGFFNSIGSSIPTASVIAALNDNNTNIEKSINEEKELNKKFASAKQEIEDFSLEPDESFFNNKVNDNKE